MEQIKISSQKRKAAPRAPKVCHWDKLPRSPLASSMGKLSMPKPTQQWWRQGQESTKLLALENIPFFNPFHPCLSLLMKGKGNRVCVKFFVVQIDRKATWLGQTLFWFSRIVVWILEPWVTDSTILICSKSWIHHTDLAHLVNWTKQTQIIPWVYVGWCLSFRYFKLWVFISFKMVSKGLQFKGKKPWAFVVK